jgi:Na+-transporting methylmalonyl-CoA/oxaloacetate decarboxylase gamma subunit
MRPALRFSLLTLSGPDSNASMKKFPLVMLSILFLAVAGCSKSDKTENAKAQESVKAPSTPDAERLKADSERLQQATANAAKAREKEQANQMTPTPTASP